MILNVALVGALSSLAVAAPLQSRNEGSKTSCNNPETRVEWRNLSADQQQSYLDAVLCLKKKPSSIGLDTSLYDDFPYVHSTLNANIHFVASFLPWHRYFVHVHALALNDCGYTGPTPFWDWTLDPNAFATSPIWSSSHGFGGNGSPNRTENIAGTIKCVDDGPLANLRPTYYQECSRCGPGKVEHCLNRDWISGNDAGAELAEKYNVSAVEIVQTEEKFLTYHDTLERGPHAAIHSAIGGDMNPATSPNEPMFFLHHAQVDRLWWLWQQENPETRLEDYSGNRVLNSGANDAELTDVMDFMGLAANVTVEDVMGTSSEILCYEY